MPFPFETADAPFAGATDGDLAARVARLEDLQAIERLKVAYVSYCDPYDAEGFAGTFAEDGVWESEHYGKFQGRPAIEELIRQADKELVWTTHFVSNMDVTLAADGLSATGRWYLHAYEDVLAEDGSVDAFEVFAGYASELVKRDGRWYFSHVAPFTRRSVKMKDGGWK